jgi:hypothetical protein
MARSHSIRVAPTVRSIIRQLRRTEVLAGFAGGLPRPLGELSQAIRQQDGFFACWTAMLGANPTEAAAN